MEIKITKNASQFLGLLIIASNLFYLPLSFAYTQDELIRLCGAKIEYTNARSPADFRKNEIKSNIYNDRIDECRNRLLNQKAYTKAVTNLLDSVSPGSVIPGMIINGKPVYKCSNGLPCIGRIMREAGVK